MLPTNRRGLLPASLMFVAGAYFLMPLWWLLVSSTKSSTALFSSQPLWFSHFNLVANLRQLFAMDDGIFGRWMVNSVLYAGVGAAAATLVSGMAGYALARYTFTGRQVVFGVILGAVLLPSSLLVMPLYLLFSQMGLINTVWSVLIPTVASPFGVYLARVYAADAVPEDVLNAARMDGAGEFRIFFTIGVRMMAPALATVFLFQFVGIWNNFFLPLVTLNDRRLWPVTLGIFSWNSQPQTLYYNVVVTGCLVSTIPLVLAFILLQRFWRAGLASSAVKL